MKTSEVLLLGECQTFRSSGKTKEEEMTEKDEHEEGKQRGKKVGRNDKTKERKDEKIKNKMTPIFHDLASCWRSIRRIDRRGRKQERKHEEHKQRRACDHGERGGETERS